MLIDDIITIEKSVDFRNWHNGAIAWGRIKKELEESEPSTSTNIESTPCDHDIVHCCDDNEWLCSVCGKSARFV